MAVKVDLTVNDSSFKARMGEAVKTFKSFATAITGAKNAQVALNSAIKANAIGMAVTAITVGAEALYKWASGAYDAAEAQKALDAQIENTSNQLKMMKDDADFDIAIAKAAGKSAMELANMRVEAAKARLAIADLNYDKVAAPDSNASKEQIAEARQMQQQAENALNRANRERTLLDIQRINKTGVYKEKKTKGKTQKVETDDFKEIIGLIPNAEEAVKSLQEQIRSSWDEGEIERLTVKLKKAEEELQRLKDIGKDVDFEKLFPTVSTSDGTSMSYNEQMMSTIRGDMANSRQDADVTTLKTLLETSLKNGIEDLEIPTDAIMEQIFGDGADIPDSYWQELQDEINKRLKELGIDPIKIDFSTGKLSKEGKAAKKEWAGAAQAIGSVAGAMASIEDPAAKIVGTIGEAIASVALGYAQATVHAAELGPWGWIAFAATGLATMLSTIASIHSATGYAQGGVIPGSSFSGDQQWARVNAGETILTQAQAGILASRLQSNGLGNLQLSAVIKGETLRLVLNNNGLRTGRGEYVQTNFR